MLVFAMVAQAGTALGQPQAPAAPAGAPHAAPAAAPGVDLVGAKKALATGPASNLLDLTGGKVGAADVSLIKGKLDALTKDTGGKAYAILLPKGADIKAWHSVYADLSMTGKDVLVVSNAEDRYLQSSALPKGAEASILASTKVDVLKSPGQGVAAAIEKIGETLKGKTVATTHAKTGAATPAVEAKPAAQSGGGLLWLWIVLAIAGVGGGAFVFIKRRSRDANIGEELRAALKPGEETIADVYLTMDGVEDHPNFGSMLERANAVQSRIDAIKKGPVTREAVEQAKAAASDASRVRSEFEGARRALPSLQ